MKRRKTYNWKSFARFCKPFDPQITLVIVRVSSCLLTAFGRYQILYETVKAFMVVLDIVNAIRCRSSCLDRCRHLQNCPAEMPQNDLAQLLFQQCQRACRQTEFLAIIHHITWCFHAQEVMVRELKFALLQVIFPPCFSQTPRRFRQLKYPGV